MIKKNITFAMSTIFLFMLTACQSTSDLSTSATDLDLHNYQVSNTSESTSMQNYSIQSYTESSVISSSSSPTSVPEISHTNGYEGERSGAIIVDETGRGIPIFGGGTGATYIKAVNDVKEKVGDQVNVFSMIVPTQGSFYMPKGFIMANEWDCIDNINDQLYGVIPVDAYSALARHTDEEIYARTDHHWMQLGAYYAAEEFVKTALIDVPFAPLSNYERHDIDGYLGSLYISSDCNATMRKNPETFTYYVSPNDFATYYMNPEDADFTRAPMFLPMDDVSQSYCIFMGGDRKIVHVDTDVENRRKLLIIKDSYPNALVPCLTGSFEEIWTADMRYLKYMQHFPCSISTIVKDFGITDVLFCMNTFSAVGENADNLIGII